MNTDEEYFKIAAKEAQKAACKKALCGSIVVLKGKVVGRGFNSPAGKDEESRSCDSEYSLEQKKPKSDRTCCVHAEWRAIMNALKNHGDISGGILYFTRVDEDGNIQKSGEPYCTVCSRLALDAGLIGFSLWHDSGIKIYDTKEYNRLSYKFHSKKI
jgi:deoxycytidylate deaminase